MIMKCEHFGKNEATLYYKSNINGNVTEHHLCSDCARELGYADSMEKSFSSFGRGLFGGFDDFFTPMPALAGHFFEPFEEMNRSFARMFPALTSGGAETASAERTGAAQSTAPVPGNDLVSDAEHRQLDHERRLNALRAELQQAIAAENFEHAAQLRDQIHGMEKEG